jgi:uncharacterized membrane protein YfcA
VYELTSLKWVLLAVASFLVGLTKSGVPGLGVLIAPLFADAIPARASTGALLPLLIVGDIFAVAYYRRHAVWKYLVKLFPWAGAGIIIGYFAMGRITDAQFRPIIGGITLLMLAVNFWRTATRGKEAPIPTQWWFAAIIGLLAGITTMIANAAGTVMLIYFLAMRLPKTEFIGTSAWYFFVLNLFKVPFSASLGFINTQSLLLNVKLAPVVLVGAVIGILVARRIPEKAFAIVIQVLALASAIRLFF